MTSRTTPTRARITGAAGFAFVVALAPLLIASPAAAASPALAAQPALSAPSTLPGAATDDLGSRWTEGGLIAKTEGRLFFDVIHDDGTVEPSSCSGTVVDSPNGSVVATAAHCAGGENYEFIPGYDDGAAPYGTWTVKEVFTTTPVDIFTADFAALTLNTLNGKTIQEVVGAQDIAFDGAASSGTLDIFGYPRERSNQPDDPYEGKHLIHSSGPKQTDPLGRIGTGSDQSHGSSGGGIFRDFDPATGAGTLVATNSGHRCADDACETVDLVMWGTPFDEVMKGLYEQASVA
ncbi:trypsin-like serine peptidase [Plantibacter sp. YIM 135347]|uniref:trypsin-like serine peptidase n=1 Tax=Plantibacter sp. YIM 135347 TaxID=3423919 RepID=UPI003D32701B